MSAALNAAAEGLQLQQAESAECEPNEDPLNQSLPGDQWTAGVALNAASPRYSCPIFIFRKLAASLTIEAEFDPNQSDSLLSLARTLHCCTLLSRTAAGN